MDTKSEDLFLVNWDTMSRLGNTVQCNSNIDLMFAVEKLLDKMSYGQADDTWKSDHFFS